MVHVIPIKDFKFLLCSINCCLCLLLIVSVGGDIFVSTTRYEAPFHVFWEIKKSQIIFAEH